MLVLALILALVTGSPLTPTHAAAAAMPLSSVPASAVPEAEAVVEILRVKVPAPRLKAWREAEAQSWEPWLRRQSGFVDRQLFWDPQREEATLLIRWASRAAWKAIPAEAVQEVQVRFEALARRKTGKHQGNPFPLVFEGELVPL